MKIDQISWMNAALQELSKAGAVLESALSPRCRGNQDNARASIAAARQYVSRADVHLTKAKIDLPFTTEPKEVAP